MPLALVTGASGFVGLYLVRHLLKQGYEVVGGVRNASARLPQGSRWVRLDLTDREAVQRIVADVRPDEIYHLAGLTHPASGTAEEFYQVNLLGTLNLLEAVRERVPEAKVLLVGSAYAYGTRIVRSPKTTVSIPLITMELLKPQQISWGAFMLCRACALCGGHSTIVDLVRRRTSYCRAWCSSLPRLR